MKSGTYIFQIFKGKCNVALNSRLSSGLWWKITNQNKDFPSICKMMNDFEYSNNDGNG